MTMYALAPAQSSDRASRSALFCASDAVEYSNCLAILRPAPPHRAQPSFQYMPGRYSEFFFAVCSEFVMDLSLAETRKIWILGSAPRSTRFAR